MLLAESLKRRPPGLALPVPLGLDLQTLAVLQTLRQRYGNIVAVPQPDGRDALFVNDPAEIRRILVRRHGGYAKGPGFERVKMLLGNGLIVADGDVWRRSRTMIQPAFARASLRRLIPLMVDCTRRLERDWSDAAAAGRSLNITADTSSFALEVILRSIFGADYERRIMLRGTNPFAFLSEEHSRDLRMVLKVRELRELLLTIVAERRASNDPESHDFLSLYLGARDNSGRGFSDSELLDELITLLVAGYETTAGTLNWTWYLLAGYPEIRDRLAREARECLQKLPDAACLAEMHSTRAVLDETMRLYPPAWLLTRRTLHEESLTDIHVEAGTDIYLSPYILHRSEDFWPEPEKFRPERFSEAEAERKGERPYFPFSLGPRRCVGEYFSFLEMKIHIGLLAQRFEMQRVSEEQPGLDLGVNLRSSSDIHLRPVERNTLQ